MCPWYVHLRCCHRNSKENFPFNPFLTIGPACDPKDRSGEHVDGVSTVSNLSSLKTGYSSVFHRFISFADQFSIAICLLLLLLLLPVSAYNFTILSITMSTSKKKIELTILKPYLMCELVHICIFILPSIIILVHLVRLESWLFETDIVSV